jgi:Flp pilus assembly protein TadD
MRQSLISLLIVTGLTAGCGIMPATDHVHYDPYLIDGSGAFGDSVAPAPVQDLLKVSPQMRAFVQDAIGDSTFPHVKFRRLMQDLQGEGFFANQYDQSATFSASQTFDSKSGNCVAYTNLFIALAREADLQANYQLVRVPPRWELDSGLLQRVNHINVHVRGVRLPGAGSDELSVDFNLVKPRADIPTQRITDAHAASMFYGNLAVEHMGAGDHQQAFAYLKRAILTAPKNTDVWTNLGALYSMLDRQTFAEDAYRVALSIDPKDQAANAGLVRSLLKQGRDAEAQTYEQIVRRYQRRNPYYQYALAERAFSNGAFDQALDAINRAIRLKRQNPEFYALRAATARELGDERLLTQSLRLQKHYSSNES